MLMNDTAAAELHF